MSADYSAGPWTRRPNQTIREPYHIIDSEGWTIATVFWNDHFISSVDANAKLIASAPELFDALKRLVNDSECSVVDGDMWDAARTLIRDIEED